MSVKAKDYSEAELKSLAEEIVDDKIFGSWNINGVDRNAIAVCFSPLKNEDIKKAKFGVPPDQVEDQEAIGHVFEYRFKATKNSLGNYPIFLTCRGLKVKFIKRLSSLIESAKKERILDSGD